MKNLILFWGILLSFNLYPQEKTPLADPKKEGEKSLPKKCEEDLEKRLLERLARFRPANIGALGRELWEKEKNLDRKETELKRRQDQVLLNEKILEKKIKSFQVQQDKILGCIDKNDKDKEKRVKHMVDVVLGMRPANAAEILSVQDEKISVRILELMPAEKVSKIFNLMDKEVSARLQKQFMGMKK